jgi:hypothetical protein
MLYDPKWKVKAKPYIYSLPALIAWLELMPPNQRYNFQNPNACAVAQYLKWAGVTDFNLYSWEIEKRFGKPVANAIYADERREMWTFGAALDRARKLQASV